MLYMDCQWETHAAQLEFEVDAQIPILMLVIYPFVPRSEPFFLQGEIQKRCHFEARFLKSSFFTKTLENIENMRFSTSFYDLVKS